MVIHVTSFVVVVTDFIISLRLLILRSILHCVRFSSPRSLTATVHVLRVHVMHVGCLRIYRCVYHTTAVHFLRACHTHAHIPVTTHLHLLYRYHTCPTHLCTALTTTCVDFWTLVVDVDFTISRVVPCTRCGYCIRCCWLLHIHRDLFTLPLIYRTYHGSTPLYHCTLPDTTRYIVVV